MSEPEHLGGKRAESARLRRAEQLRRWKGSLTEQEPVAAGGGRGRHRGAFVGDQAPGDLDHGGGVRLGIGCELGGAFKNIIALGAGIADGLGLGDNSKAAFMTRGLTEIARLGMTLGAKQETFAGLSGVGDLIVTCCSMHSRNRRAGILIGQGKTAEQAMKEVGATVEGYYATEAGYHLAKQQGVSMPITEAMYEVLYNGLPATEGIRMLLRRPRRGEHEEVWVH